jgi:hypothetical protein
MKKLGLVLMCALWGASVAGAQQAAGTQNPPAPQAATEKAGPPAHPATEDQIREYLSLVGAEKTAHEMMDNAVQAMQATSAPYFPADFWSDMRAEFRKLDVTAANISVYQRYLSQEDMKAAIDFYRSPAGKRLLAAQPLITQDAQAAMRAKGQEIGEAVYARHKDEIEAAKKRFEAGQPKPEINLTPQPK